MDTDNLTDMAYQTIILANEAADVLKCELGVLSGRFKSEDEYLKGVIEYLAELAEEPEDYLDAWGLHDVTDVSTFVEQLDKLRLHVQTTLKIPYPKRGAPGF